MLLIVWSVVLVLSLVVLGGVAYGVFGAFARLGREVASFEGEVRPVLQQVQATAVRRRVATGTRTPPEG